MNSESQQPHSFSHWKDAVAFFVTVATCTFLLTAACTLTKTTEMVADTFLVLATPQPPTPLVLAPEPEPDQSAYKLDCTMPEFEMAWTMPEFKMAWIIPEFEVAAAEIETILTTSSVPHGAITHKPIPFHGIIDQVAGRYEVDPHLIRAIIFAESGYNPRAKSKKGARGLMQLMPSTAEALGVQDIYDPEENIDGGVRYFRSLLDRFDGDVQLALAAYNAGSRHVRNYEGVPPFRATRLYIKKVLKFRKKFKFQSQWPA